MAKSLRKNSRKPRSAKFDELTAVAAVFDHRTKITENCLDAEKEAWRLGFDNGHSIVICSDGTCQIMRE